ncbi:MAG: hypothetical protein JSR17_07075 [Proteobacteria bacterium]|nr:hypothetical protein [Pseudomonadota bacterium]
MQGYCSKLIYTFIAISLSLPVSAYVDNYSVETFYKDATYSHFLRSITESYNHQYVCDPGNTKLIVYAIHVLKKHPDFAVKLVDDFGTLEDCQQQVVCASLAGASYHNEHNAINAQYNGVCTANQSLAIQNANNITFLNKIETVEDENRQALYMASCWAAFFATGDEKTIAKMAEYAKAHQGQSDHQLAIAEFESSAMLLAQQDPTINDILTKQSYQCLSCFR